MARPHILSSAAARLRVGGLRAMEGAMLKAILSNKSVPRVEIDQRARDARLRLEQIERRLVPRAAVAASWFKPGAADTPALASARQSLSRALWRPASSRSATRPLPGSGNAPALGCDARLRRTGGGR
jgi:hypothetical protein